MFFVCVFCVCVHMCVFENDQMLLSLAYIFTYLQLFKCWKATFPQARIINPPPPCLIMTVRWEKLL